MTGFEVERRTGAVGRRLFSRLTAIAPRFQKSPNRRRPRARSDSKRRTARLGWSGRDYCVAASIAMDGITSSAQLNFDRVRSHGASSRASRSTSADDRIPARPVGYA